MDLIAQGGNHYPRMLLVHIDHLLEETGTAWIVLVDLGDGADGDVTSVFEMGDYVVYKVMYLDTDPGVVVDLRGMVGHDRVLRAVDDAVVVLGYDYMGLY